jgi:hypothetical protein
MTAAIGSAARAVIGDLDGDGKAEIVVVDGKLLRVLDRTGTQLVSAPVPSGIQRLVAADLDGDDRAELVAGWGQTREQMAGQARITVHRLERGALVEELVAAPETSRQDVAAIVPMPDAGGVLYAYFESKYVVRSAIAKRGPTGWASEPVTALRMATSYARGDVDGDGTPDLVIGRMYGDAAGLDGDAFVLGPRGARTAIPTTRGLRSIAVADTDGDGKAEVFLGDGWHHDYGRQARALVTWARHTGEGFTTELIEDTQGQYAIERMVPATIDGLPAIVTLGSHHVRVFVRTDGAWRGLTIAGAARDIAVGELDGEPGDEILIVGERSEIVRLRAADWR